MNGSQQCAQKVSFVRGATSGVVAAAAGSLVFAVIFPLLYLPPDLVLLNFPLVLLGGFFVSTLCSIIPGALGGVVIAALLRDSRRRECLGTRSALIAGVGIGAVAGGLALLTVVVARKAPGITSSWYTVVLVLLIGMLGGVSTAFCLSRRAGDE